ncbi:MAG: FtsX-like permease family protein, partial [Myxococcota bacterium]|nr:FtsX-like permease family protein [Myxococcota bacterium]
VRAMGMQNRDVQLMFLLEGTIMGLLAGICGGLLGGALNYYLSYTGIDLSSKADTFGEVPIPTVIYTAFSISQILWAISFGLIVALLASIWPAQHAVSIHPADAVRRN